MRCLGESQGLSGKGFLIGVWKEFMINVQYMQVKKACTCWPSPVDFYKMPATLLLLGGPNGWIKPTKQGWEKCVYLMKEQNKVLNCLLPVGGWVVLNCLQPKASNQIKIRVLH